MGVGADEVPSEHGARQGRFPTNSDSSLYHDLHQRHGFVSFPADPGAEPTDYVREHADREDRESWDMLRSVIREATRHRRAAQGPRVPVSLADWSTMDTDRREVSALVAAVLRVPPVQGMAPLSAENTVRVLVRNGIDLPCM